jgi:hypothetical protein
MAILQRLPSHPPAIIYFVLHCTRNSNDGNRTRWLPTPPITAPVPPLWICTEPHHHILPPTATAHTSSPPLHKIFVSWIANLLPRAWVLQPTPQPYYFSLHYKIWSLWCCCCPQANRSSLSWWMQRRFIRVGKSSALHRFAGDTTLHCLINTTRLVLCECVHSIVYFAINQQ